MWILLFIGAGVVSAFVHLFIVGFGVGTSIVCSIFLLHQFVVPSALIGILGFIINVLKADKTAKNLGWPGGPFQWKYGFSQLGVGVMGVMSIWFRGQFWLGTLVTLYVYGASGLWSHAGLMIQNKKADKVEIANIVLDIVYHAALTVLILQIPSVWA